MKKRFFVTKPEELRIIELYEAGWSIRVVSEMTGRSQTTVWNVLDRNGIERRARKGTTHQKLPDSEFEKTRLLYESGMPISHVARHLGRTHGAILWRLRRSGVELRPRSEVIRQSWETRRRKMHSKTNGQPAQPTKSLTAQAP